MKIIVEEYNYKSEPARRIIEQFEHKELKEGVSTDYVGYCYSRSLNDCVFFVPKVICDTSDRILGKYDPEKCVDISNSELDTSEKRFIQELNVWIYRALKEYSNLAESSNILRSGCFNVVSGAGYTSEATFLDRILALIQFYKDNREFFIFTTNNIHSQRNKINWRKTISRSQAFIQDETPIYFDPISKKREIDWDEELMVIFFSILEHINHYGFDIRTEHNYDLIKGAAFEAYLDGLGVRRLRQIRHKYFSDTTRKLWSLCYAFFDMENSISSSKSDKDFLLATSFHIAFESMVDELIGQPELSEMKYLDDGKIIDHIYKDTSLLSKDLIYFIGDSKYYKTRLSVRERSNSAYKQFTYARNIVQDSISDSFGNTWPFRDPLTEGYVITPNFFISAEIDSERRFDLDGFEKADVNSSHFSSRQFNNRLFDRDTLWVNQYNLNFLYLLSTYASADSSSKESFRKKARSFFRKRTIDLLNSEYDFWELEPKDGLRLDDVLSGSLLWALRGTVYRLGEQANTLLFAMERPDIPENEEDLPIAKYEREADFLTLKPIIEEHFNHKRCVLSQKEDSIIEYIENPKGESGKFFFFFFFDDE